MMSENREIFLFQNIRQVILAERWCLENSLEVKVIPVPRPYSTECGMCLETTMTEGDQLAIFVQEQGLIVRRISGFSHT
ncbi:MAG: DUF3343 domain-containing protein [Prolixibacteraceae bacterium]